MSDLSNAVLEWCERLHELTGEDPPRLVLPARAYDMLLADLAKEPMVEDGDPVSGVGGDGRLWLACTEIVRDNHADYVPITISRRASPNGCKPMSDDLRYPPPEAYAVRLKLRTPAARFEYLCDLYAPRDEDGVRQPDAGIIDKDMFMRLLEAPTVEERQGKADE